MMWMGAILVLGRWREEDQLFMVNQRYIVEFEGNLGYMMTMSQSDDDDDDGE